MRKENRMKITCPNNNVQERTYIIRFLFESMLGIPTSIHFSEEEKNYTIEVSGNKKIIVEDHFFNSFPEPLSYLDKKNVPVNINWFCFEGEDYPIIFGENRYVQSDNEAILGLDVFASSFFMLSRWEEYVLGREDPLKNSKSIYQLDESSLFCVRNGIYDRQIVFEYEFILRCILDKLGYHIDTKRESGLLISHDVDSLGPRPFRRVLEIAFSYGKSNGVISGLKWLWLNIQIGCFSLPRRKIFDYYFRSAYKYGFSQVFLLKCCRRNEVECTYEIDDIRTKRIIRMFHNKGIIWGFHPSQSVFCNDRQFEEEYKRFLDVTRIKPLLGRNHRLLHNTNTWHQWEGVLIPLTSNWGYQSRVGFRCGISIPFPVFDVFLRENTKVMELPFSMMDSSLLRFAKKEKEMGRIIDTIIASTIRYGGIMCINWHVRPFVRKEFMLLFKMYNKILQTLSEKGVQSIKVECFSKMQ